MTLPGLMKHVRILEDAQLVVTEKKGRARECRLGTEQLDDAARWIETYRGRWERRLDRLEGYLERQKGAQYMSHDLRLEHLYEADPATVFDAFTDPDAQHALYADAPDWVVESACPTCGSGAAGRRVRPSGAARRPARPACSRPSTGRGGSPMRPTMTMPDGDQLRHRPRGDLRGGGAAAGPG